MQDNKKRCSWCGNDPLYMDYHDHEWGQPLHDDRQLFEMLCLEGAQAGLSWITVLRKRESYRIAFDNFDAVKMAHYGDEKRAELLQDPGIIRNKLKVNAFIENAKAYLKVKEEFGTFDKFIWSFVNNKVVDTSLASLREYPTRTDVSDAMSKELKRRGFKFIGTTICYAYMQAVGMVNDHVKDCWTRTQGK